MSVATHFRELKVYCAAREAALQIFEVSKGFPREERFSLTDQIRRSSRAVGAMIAEAWADSTLDATYLSDDDHHAMSAEWERIAAMLSRMIDRASDFSKNAPDTDYRTREESEVWGDL